MPSSLFNLTNAEIAHSMWAFTGGAILVLLQSILSGAKRNWSKLLLGCILGGLGSWSAGEVFSDSPYVFWICGVAAVMAENIIGGFFNASKEFADSPIKVLTHIARTFLPTFGKSAGDTSTPIDMNGVK
jgi:hypothetical protein